MHLLDLSCVDHVLWNDSLLGKPAEYEVICARLVRKWNILARSWKIPAGDDDSWMMGRI